MNDNAAPIYAVGRRAKCICLIGANGTGKSTLAVTLMNRQPRGLILLPSFDNWAVQFAPCACARKSDFDFVGIHHRIMDSGNIAAFDAIYKHFTDGLLVCDDPLTYTPKNLEEHPLKKILGRRRQMRCDVLFMAHSFMRLPPMFFSYVTDYVVYNTDLGDVDKRKTDLGQHYTKIRQMVQNANRAAAQNPHYCEIYKTGL